MSTVSPTSSGSLGACKWGVGVNDRLDGEKVIFELITDDAKSIPPVKKKPNITRTHTRATTCILGSLGY